MDQVRTSANGGSPSHQPNGKFAKGNKAARGNPVARRMHAMRLELMDAIDAGTVRAVIRRLAVSAIRDGDTTAAKLILEYTCGRPPQGVELSGPDGSPLGATLATVEDAVLEALKPHGAAAQFQVAAVLRGLAHHGDDDQE